MSDKVSQNRLKKQGVLEELKDKTVRAKAIVFTNYQGLTHKQLEELKKAVKPLQAEFVVAKNTLLSLALGERAKITDSDTLEGPTGTMFIYDDIVAPLKELSKTIKALNIPSIKFGLMDKERISAEQILKLATLPTREVLLAQLVGGLKSPISGLHRALNWNLQKLVLTLKAIEKSRGGDI